mgnify:CR=1 FL=1
MTQRNISILLAAAGLLFFGLAISGCGQGEPALPSPTLPAPTVEVSPTAETAGQTGDVLLNEDADPGDETDHCLDCHTDQDRLMEIADPVVETESENEGEG